MFQSHAGSIEAKVIPQSECNTCMFQSHAGSIEAGQFRRTGRGDQDVSIPRWFD